MLTVSRLEFKCKGRYTPANHVAGDSWASPVETEDDHTITNNNWLTVQTYLLSGVHNKYLQPIHRRVNFLNLQTCYTYMCNFLTPHHAAKPHSCNFCLMYPTMSIVSAIPGTPSSCICWHVNTILCTGRNLNLRLELAFIQ